MKAIQVMFDGKLLEEMDFHEEVRKRGRSAVLREAAAEYLKRSRARRIAEQYRQAYAREPLRERNSPDGRRKAYGPKSEPG